MRASLYQYLTDNCTTVSTWKQPYTADASTPKPYGVIKFDGRPRDTSRTSFQDVRIWIYFEPGSYLSLDAAVQEVTTLLSDQLITKAVPADPAPVEEGEPDMPPAEEPVEEEPTPRAKRFLVEFVYEGQDFFDDELKAICRFIDFRIPLGG
jgi:hypothetical protein